jgi:hypothetical protein
MRYILQSFVLIALGFLIISIPSEAGNNEFAEVEFYLSRDCIGENCNLAIEEPTSSRPKYWVAQNDPPVQNEYYPLATWEINMGGPLELGDSYSYIIWVESTNVQEINFRTTLFIIWIDYSVDPAKSRMTNISVDEVGKTAPFASVLSENYTVELESSTLDKSDFPNGVPAYTTFGMKLETSIRWAPDTDNNTAWIKSDTPDFDSSLTINFKHVDIVNDYLGYFDNNRVDEMNEDSLLIKVNVTNALGADNLDATSASIEIAGVSGSGTFKNSVIAKEKHTYAMYIQGTWWYQEDQNVVTDSYTIEFSIKDIYGNTWTSSLNYDLIVDEYGLDIEFEEGYSKDGQLPKGGKVDYEFLILNQGNTRDIYTIELDASDLPSSWEASLTSQSELDIPAGQYSYVQVRVEAPVSAPGGSKEEVTVIVTSSGNTNINQEISLETTVRTYGVTFLSPPDEVIIDPDELDIDGYYTFSINIRNTGSDRDTYKVDATTARGDWTIRVEMGGNKISAITVEKSVSVKIDVVLRPVNYEDTLGEAVTFVLTADSISPGDGSATLSSSIIMAIPVDKISDLSVVLADVLVNGKPISLLTESDITSANPIQIQLTVYNNGGKSTGSFGVKLYEGSRVIDEYTVIQGIEGFGNEPVILTWDNPSAGSKTLKIYVDFEQQVTESNSNRFDNSLTLPLVVGEKSSSSGDSSNEDSLLYGPSHLLTAIVLVIFTIINRKRN